MREYELIVDKALRVGLSPEASVPTNSQVLYSCFGFRIGPAGLERYVTLTNPIITSILYSWPFPQMVAGERYNILVVRDVAGARDLVYSVSDNHVTVTLIATIDIATYGTGWLMDIADFGEYLVMTNGVANVYYNPVSDTWFTFVSTPVFPLLGTICNFKGQLFGGNVRTSWHSCDSTYFAWAAIGTANFTPNNYNEAGFKRDIYGGTIYHVRPFDRGIIGYSSKGVTLISPVTDPTPTFGFFGLTNLGLINRGAVAGDDKRQVFVCEDRRVREIDNQGIKILGYKWLIDQLTSGDVIVNYDSGNDDFFVGDGQRTFLLSRNGMTEVQQNPSAVWRRNGQSYVLPSTVNSSLPYITSWPNDLGYAGKKTSQIVEISAEGYTGGDASVDYRLGLTWGTGAFTPINNEGVATIVTEADAFRLKTRFATLTNEFKIAHLRCRYKMTDLRSTRGVYAPPIRGQG